MSHIHEDDDDEEENEEGEQKKNCPLLLTLSASIMRLVKFHML
jgi:hypothetical protein